MKFGVITFPGSNCDRDMLFAVTRSLNSEVVSLWHKDTDLQGCDFIFLPGGFSYGDYLRTGALAKFSPIMKEVVKFANKGGFVMGICNGFQILTEAGLLEGALVANESMKFICDNQYIKPVSKTAILTAGLENRAYKIPIAHAEGRFVCSEDNLKSLQDNDQILFRYCDSYSYSDEDNNPNGSIFNIAGIANKNKNVFGMMPHPERAADPYLKNEDGSIILANLLKLVPVH